MPHAEESLKTLVKSLIHDVRNQVNGLVLELTDLRERWPEARVTTETESLMRQAMEMAQKLKDVRERLEPGAARRQRLLLTDAWAVIAPEAELLSTAAGNDEIEVDLAQMKQAINELVLNAIEAGHGTATAVGDVVSGKLVVSVENPVATAPALIEQWGHTPGHSGKRRHLGLGCAFVLAVAHANDGEATWSYDAAKKIVRAEIKLPVVG